MVDCRSINTVVVSYWAGRVPEITELHFKSFLHNNDLNFRYVLFLDEKSRFNSSLPPSLNWILRYESIQVQTINLEKLMSACDIRKFSLWKDRFFFKLVRKLRFTITSRFVFMLEFFNLNIFQGIISKANNAFVSYNHPHTSTFTGLSEHLTYRSDVFRSLIAKQYERDNILYVDLDICFTKKFSEFEWDRPFSSPWGLESFANTAVLFLPNGQSKVRDLILKEFQLHPSAWPWELYSSNNCRKFGIQLKPIEYFDSAWSSNSPNSGDSKAFFEKRQNTKTLIDWIDQNSFCNHWHNQWKVVPEPGSPYSIYLARFENI
jgi:hypothetical protein